MVPSINWNGIDADSRTISLVVRVIILMKWPGARRQCSN